MATLTVPTGVVVHAGNDGSGHGRQLQKGYYLIPHAFSTSQALSPYSNDFAATVEIASTRQRYDDYPTQ